MAVFVVDALARRPRLTWPVLAAGAALAVAPDLDILAGSHRTYSHSIGAVLIVCAICWLLRARLPGPAAAAALTAAYGSHLALDWLSRDTSAPSGLMALWPMTAEYYKSGWDVFGEISRRYWRPEEFLFGNLRAALRELALLAPFLLVAWAVWSAATVKTNSGREAR